MAKPAKKAVKSKTKTPINPYSVLNQLDDTPHEADLSTIDGVLLKRVKLPPYVSYPTVLSWKGRTFTFWGVSGGTDEGRVLNYREAAHVHTVA